MEMYQENCLALYRLMTHENYTQELTKKLGSLCSNPVLTMDYMHRVHSHCGNGTENSITWNEMIRTGSLNPQRISEFFHNVMKQLIFQAQPIQICYENETMILTPVITDGTFMGLIAVLEISHSLTQEEISYTQIMADILSIHCEKNNSHDSDTEYKHHHIILDLLENKISSRKKLQERMYERNWKKADFYRVLLADISCYHHTYQKFIKDQCAYYWIHCKILIYKGYLLILEESNHPIIKKSIENWLTQFHLRTGISDNFHELFDLSVYIRQAMQALALSKDDPTADNIYYYDSFRLQDYFIQCNANADNSTYYHPDIVKLQEYDCKHNTHLFDTLYIYLQEDKSIQNTALKLNVHNNTINYRIKKIKELFPNIFENNSSIFHAMLTYCLMKYQ